MAAVYCVPGPRSADGVNIAVLPTTLTVPFTLAPPPVGFRVKVEELMVTLFIGFENVAEIAEFSETSVWLFEGAVSETVGGLVSTVEDDPLAAGFNGGVSPPPPPAPHAARKKTMPDIPARSIPFKTPDIDFLVILLFTSVVKVYLLASCASHMPREKASLIQAIENENNVASSLAGDTCSA
ncbi:MAG TPA: hypothetical protein VHB46_16435 [Burkholderiales bacterium]|nr:hypothetical protein [Burkholderiales bacterium]